MFREDYEIQAKFQARTRSTCSRPLNVKQHFSEIVVDRRKNNLILLNVCIGQTIVGLDQRALLVALPTLTEYFHTAFTTIRWTILSYDLVLIGLVITMGRLGDLFGRRRLYTAGFVLFVAGSALCIMSPPQPPFISVFSPVRRSVVS